MIMDQSEQLIMGGIFHFHTPTVKLSGFTGVAMALVLSPLELFMSQFLIFILLRFLDLLEATVQIVGMMEDTLI